MSETMEKLAVCIGCGCDDVHACVGGCSWVRLDQSAGLGVCSKCPGWIVKWDRGDRTLSSDAQREVEEREAIRKSWPAGDIGKVPCTFCGFINVVQLSVVREFGLPERPAECEHCGRDFFVSPEMILPSEQPLEIADR